MTENQILRLFTHAAPVFASATDVHAVDKDLEAMSLIQNIPTPVGTESQLWALTERGRALVDHVRALDLPEQVTVWRVPGAAEPFLPPLYRVNQVSGSVMYVDEGQPPPRAATATALPRGDIPTDPEQLRLAVLSHLNNGFGEGETAERFGLTRKEVSTYFDAG